MSGEWSSTIVSTWYSRFARAVVVTVTHSCGVSNSECTSIRSWLFVRKQYVFSQYCSIFCSPPSFAIVTRQVEVFGENISRWILLRAAGSTYCSRLFRTFCSQVGNDRHWVIIQAKTKLFVSSSSLLVYVDLDCVAKTSHKYPHLVSKLYWFAVDELLSTMASKIWAHALIDSESLTVHWVGEGYMWGLSGRLASYSSSTLSQKGVSTIL